MSFSAIHVFAAALVLFLVIGFFIYRQNSILENAGTHTGFTAYNQKKNDPEELMRAWRKAPYSKAVKTIIFLDFIWMAVFGLSIAYGLIIISGYGSASWKAACITGVVLIALMVIIDASQDLAIYRHLAYGKMLDIRNLTIPKFMLLLIAGSVLCTGLLNNWRLITGR